MTTIKLAAKPGKKLWSITALSEEFDVDRRTVKKRLMDIPPAGMLRNSPAWHIADAAMVLSSLDLSGGDLEDPSLLPPDLRDKHYAAELKRLKFEELERMLIPESEYYNDLSAVLKLVVGTLENIPDILERDCNLDGEAVNRCIETIDGLRNELAKDIHDLNVDEVANG